METGQTTSLRGDGLFSTYRLTRFPSHSLIMSELDNKRFKSAIAAGKDDQVLAASTRLVGLDTASAPLRASAALPNVVLILVESWASRGLRIWTGILCDRMRAKVFRKSTR